MTTPSVSAHDVPKSQRSQPPRPVLPPEDGCFSCSFRPENGNLDEGCRFHYVALQAIVPLITPSYMTINVLSLSWFEYRVVLLPLNILLL